MVDEQEQTGLLVIGAGPGGYVAAIRAGQLGIDTVLADRDVIGGTCLNYGCIPSKAFLTATGRVEAVKDAAEMGIKATTSVNFEQLVRWKDEVVDDLTSGVEALCRGNDVSILRGHAEFLDESTARITTDNGDVEVSFDSAIIATGSQPMTVPNFKYDGERILDSRCALSLSEVPDQLVVVGAGYIGMELSTVFARLDTTVTVVEMLNEAMPAFDRELTRPVVKRLRNQGVTFQFGEAAIDWRENDDDITVFTETEEGKMAEYDGEHALVAVGRTPVTDGLGLDTVGLSTNEQGFIETDDHRRTDVGSVYAVGDITGEPMLAHKASHEGVVAAETIAGEEVVDPLQPIPAVVFTDPEIGTIGLDEEAASKEGHKPVLGTFPFKASGRALSRAETDGFVRLIGDAETGEVLGGQIAGAEASELIGEIGIAMRAEMTLDELAGTVYTHPTLSEAVMEAAANALEKSIHVQN